MSYITIQNLDSNGMSLFDDPETHLIHLDKTDDVLLNVKGGCPCLLGFAIYAAAAIGGGILGYEIGSMIRTALE